MIFEHVQWLYQVLGLIKAKRRCKTCPWTTLHQRKETSKKDPAGCRLFIPWPKFLAGHGAMPYTRKEISLTLSQETLQTQSPNYIRSRLKNSSPGSQTLEHFSRKTRWLAFQWISPQQDCKEHMPTVCATNWGKQKARLGFPTSPVCLRTLEENDGTEKGLKVRSTAGSMQGGDSVFTTQKKSVV